jgi:diketogulonate reductase-like aldo/keto reductase
VGTGVAAALEPGLKRADVYLQTKFTPVSGQDPNRIPYDPRAPQADQVSQSIAVSLRNLQTDYLDCVLLHSPMPTMAETQTVWRALETWVDAGRIRQLGISNCDELDDLQCLYDGARIKPAVVQNRFYADTRYDHEIRAFCGRRDMVYQSFWTLSANPHLLTHGTMTVIASTHHRSAAQILFRYLTQAGVVPLTGTKSEIHMREDLAIFDFELTDAERRDIDRLIGGP